MKVGTTELIKFLKLQRRLGQSKIVIVGLLELLWQGTAKNCPDGDIGRFDNEDIAAMVDWPGDSDELICALIDCKWLDENEDSRLLVHDWLDHCPSFVKGNLKQREMRKDGPKDSPKDSPKDGPKDGPNDSPTKPILSYPITNPIQFNPSEGASLPHAPTRTNEFLKSWERWKSHSLENGKRVSGIAEETQLQRLLAALPNEADAIKAIEFSIERNARNLITNGDSSLSFDDRPQKLTKYQKVQQAIAAMKANNE